MPQTSQLSQMPTSRRVSHWQHEQTLESYLRRNQSHVGQGYRTKGVFNAHASAEAPSKVCSSVCTYDVPVCQTRRHTRLTSWVDNRFFQMLSTSMGRRDVENVCTRLPGSSRVFCDTSRTRICRRVYNKGVGVLQAQRPTRRLLPDCQTGTNSNPNHSNLQR